MAKNEHQEKENSTYKNNMKQLSKFSFIALFCLFFCFFGCKKQEPVLLGDLSCTEATFNFGHLPVLNGKAIGKHVFTIQNNTDKEIKLRNITASCPCIHIDNHDTRIPAKGIGKVAITATYPDSDIRGREAYIALIPEEKDKQPLRITIIGYADFNTFLPQGDVAFDATFRNDFQKEVKEFFVYNGNQREVKGLITKVWTDKPQFVEITIGKQYTEKATVGDYYNHRGNLLVSLKIQPDTPLGVDSAKIFIETKTGERKEAIVRWEVREKTVFAAGKAFYLISLKPNEERLFSLCYNTKVGGVPKVFKSTGKGLELLTTESRGNEVWVTLKYTSGDTVKPDEKVGELIVETEDGKMHKLEVIAS